MIGQWGGEEPGQPSLVLWAGGRVSGSDGCNRLMGSWRAEGDGYLFSQMASTMMYCQGVDTWLSRRAGFLAARGPGNGLGNKKELRPALKCEPQFST